MQTKSPTLQNFDAHGIPIDLGNRKQRRALAKENRRGGIGEDAHSKFEKEPVWKAMERVMKHMKAWYALNGAWVFQDKEAMEILNGMRVEHEKREQEIRNRVAEAKQKEHDRIEEVFARVEDQKVLKNQLKSMNEEWKALQEISRVRTQKQTHG